MIGTYGRGIWVTNIAPLEELNAAVLAKDVHLFSISDTVQRVPWQFAANDYLFGQQNLQTPNPPNGMGIWYYLKQAASSAPAIVITDSAGNQVAKLTGSGDAGLHFVLWDTRRPRPGGGGGRGGGGGAGAIAPGQTVVDQLEPLGAYTVTLEVGAVRQNASRPHYCNAGLVTRHVAAGNHPAARSQVGHNRPDECRSCPQRQPRACVKPVGLA